MSSTSRRKPEVSKHNFVLYFIRVGLGLSSFRKSKIKSEKTVDLSLKKYDFYGVGWTHVAQGGNGNNANECMGSYGDSSLKTLFSYFTQEN